MLNRPQVGVAVIVRKGSQVLLLRRINAHGAGTWAVPGGHLEFGEAPEQCAAREVREETGIDVGELTFRAITNDLFEPEDRHYITIWMEGRWAAGDAGICAPAETSEVRWCAWDALPAPLFLPLAHLLCGECYPATAVGLAAPQDSLE